MQVEMGVAGGVGRSDIEMQCIFEFRDGWGWWGGELMISMVCGGAELMG